MSRFYGTVTDHKPLSIVVDPPVLPVDVENHALAAAREKSLTITDDRRILLRTCAEVVEGELQRVVWPPAARVSTMRVIVRTRTFALPYCELYPMTVMQAVTSVRLWSDDAQDWTPLTPSNGYRYVPDSRILVDVAGTYEIVSTLTAPTPAPPNAVEAVARLWAYRETLRPGDLTEISGEQQVLSGGMNKSGASEALRAEKWWVPL